MKNKGLRIAVLSGKGGTGKTLVSVNLASVAGNSVYIDCDVEEPDGHLFFKPVPIGEEKVGIKIPAVDDSLCTGCRKCVEFCRFNALAFLKNRPYIFKEVCHSCGGCALVCPVKAISETDRVIGEVRKGKYDNVTVYTGIMNTGEESGVPVIKKLLESSRADEELLTVIDCPPGSACPVMESIKDADYCVLVAEPTVFGVHNLGMVYELVKVFKKPHGVVLNKCLDGENPAEAFCKENGIPVIGSIPFDPELGRINSNAFIVSRESPKYRALFTSLLHTIEKEALDAKVPETASDPQR